ncbi:putative fad binding domain-protein [Staphylotrichum tortipilum]|uniref:Fad binding domain-protein n=1 Tax=Staphylotrichum tortipilum TaxID=2831512 RepID=A0AAN6MHW8_9PEZI|nr:putative fad binding domain-protein [Staphylotrichum longicolle]
MLQSLRVALCVSVAFLAGASLGALTLESVQLRDDDVAGFPGAKFGLWAGHHPSKLECKAFPGTDDWPSEREWRRLNATLGGALLQPVLPAAACYAGPNYDADKCAFLVNNASRSHFYIDDPVTVLTQWPQGETCLPVLNATGTCTRGGFPDYVVNASTVRHVQAAVNFARNNNVRLIIKNKGHDFGGRALGAGSLSIWTHHLDDFEFLPHYRKGRYSGPVAHFGAGLEQYMLFNYMSRYNITMVGSGVRTIGANGGWFAHGGHGNLASFYGLGADQALELGVVTANGRFVIANEEENTDLFFALRGGGPSTYGVVVSVTVKTYPPITLTSSTLSIACNPPADANARAQFSPISAATNLISDPSRFWDAIAIYFRYKQFIVDHGGVDWDYLYPLGNSSFTFRTSITFPNTTAAQAAALLAPLYTALQAAGFPITLNTTALTTTPYSTSSTQPPPSSNGLSPQRYRSRLLPRANWASDRLFAATMSALRGAVADGGYPLHTLAIGATNAVAGWPGRTGAVNPAWRDGIVHAILVTQQPARMAAADARAEEARAGKWTAGLRAVAPRAGAYLNEGDPGEMGWQRSFYGRHYERLLEVKRERDPWGVFWAATTVGGEAWEVRSVDGYPRSQRSQNGRLCRTGRVWEDEEDEW